MNYGKGEGKPGMSIEVEVEKEEPKKLMFDDEKGSGDVQDPLAKFEDEDIMMSLKARPHIMEMLKEELGMGNEKAEEEEEGMEEADEPVDIAGAY